VENAPCDCFRQFFLQNEVENVPVLAEFEQDFALIAHCFGFFFVMLLEREDLDDVWVGQFLKDFDLIRDLFIDVFLSIFVFK